VEIAVLHRQGMGVRAIAREVGVARNTVRPVSTGWASIGTARTSPFRLVSTSRSNSARGLRTPC